LNSCGIAAALRFLVGPGRVARSVPSGQAA
jgi:hypothetical protein